MSVPSRLSLFAAWMIALFFPPLRTRAGPRLAPLVLPGNQSGSASTLVKNSDIEPSLGRSPFGSPFLFVRTWSQTNCTSPYDDSFCDRHTSRRAQALACSRPHSLPSRPTSHAVRNSSWLVGMATAPKRDLNAAPTLADLERPSSRNPLYLAMGCPSTAVIGCSANRAGCSSTSQFLIRQKTHAGSPSDAWCMFMPRHRSC